jgi:hypothetical protein
VRVGGSKSLKPLKDNCILFAVRCWWHRGGYVIIRKSHFGWWPHAFWSLNLMTFEEFTPLDRTPHKILPPLIFEGHVLITTAAEQILRKNEKVIGENETR